MALEFITKLLVVFDSTVHVLTGSPVINTEYPVFGNEEENVTVAILGFPKKIEPETAPVLVFGTPEEKEDVCANDAVDENDELIVDIANDAVVLEPDSMNDAVIEVRFLPEPKNDPLTYDAKLKSIFADPETSRDEDIVTTSKLAVFI